ncbi:hypothetical protein HZC34_04160 [Candidatus Saganbacteria bacterium]|nr:hypothetical protein [Candidatus Saganbacteria bacterium]
MFNWKILILVLLLSFFSMAALYAEELSNTKIGFYKSKIAKVESNIKQLKAKLSKTKGKSKAKISKLLSAPAMIGQALILRVIQTGSAAYSALRTLLKKAQL